MTFGLVLLDNTVLTNFALVGRPELVSDLWGSDCATTMAVMAEFEAGVESRGLSTHSWTSLTQLTLLSTERAFADQLPSRLGAGERACLAIAVHRWALFVCDEADARRVANELLQK